MDVVGVHNFVGFKSYLVSRWFSYTFN